MLFQPIRAEHPGKSEPYGVCEEDEVKAWRGRSSTAASVPVDLRLRKSQHLPSTAAPTFLPLLRRHHSSFLRFHRRLNHHAIDFAIRRFRVTYVVSTRPRQRTIHRKRARSIQGPNKPFNQIE